MRRETIYRIITIILLIVAVLYVSKIRGKEPIIENIGFNTDMLNHVKSDGLIIKNNQQLFFYPLLLSHKVQTPLYCQSTKQNILYPIRSGYYKGFYRSYKQLQEKNEKTLYSLNKDTNNFLISDKLGNFSNISNQISEISNDTILTCGTIQPEKDIEQFLPEGFQLPQVVTIPVVFHVVWNTAAQNIPDQQLFDQLDALNRDFRRLNSDTTNAPLFNSFGADTEVEFCLAVRDPNGNPTTGITRTQTSTTCFSTNNNVKFNSTGGKDIWDRNKYLNIWVAPLCSNLGGYAQFPCGSASTDGIVNVVSYTGQVGGVYGLGRIAVHEVGHWLGLYHTFQGGCASNDFCADTPPTGQANFGCPSTTGGVFYDACTTTGAGVMYQNYMDYTNDYCKSLFTYDQKLRIDNTLMGCRASLLTSDGCVPVNAPNPPQITAQNTNICIGEYSQFQTTSINPTWSVIGGTMFGGANSSVIQVHFLSTGTFYVKLTTSGGSDSVAVTVSNCPKVQNIYTNWDIGKEVAVTFFTTGAKIAGLSKLTGIEACQTISDAFGNELFSTDFKTVWDANGGQVATGLLGSPNSGNMVSATSGLILPSLTTANIYYIFCVSDMGGINHGLVWYTYNSQTKAISGANYVTQNFPIAEGVSATRHCYGNGWIIAAHGKEHSNPVTNWNGTDYSDKIITTYFQDGLNYTLAVNPSYDITSYGYGQMKFSPSGNFLAAGETSTGRIELYSFNREFGTTTFIKFFNYFNTTIQGSGYGLEFSPDETRLYSTGGFSIVSIKCLVQWDISTSQMTVLNCTGWPGQLQLGVDNKIYVSHYGQNGYARINDPNAYGLGCNYVYNDVWAYLPTTRFVTYGLPNNLNSINASVGWCSSVPLPIELLSFEGEHRGDHNYLEWVTASEKNNDRFLLEKSYDLKEWFPLAEIPGAGNSQFTNYYSFKDVYVTHGSHYYRLWQIDYDGTKTLSQKIVSIYVKSQKKEIKIFDVYGNLVFKGTGNPKEIIKRFDAGIYFCICDNKVEKLPNIK